MQGPECFCSWFPFIFFLVFNCYGILPCSVQLNVSNYTLSKFNNVFNFRVKLSERFRNECTTVIQDVCKSWAMTLRNVRENLRLNCYRVFAKFEVLSLVLVNISWSVMLPYDTSYCECAQEFMSQFLNAFEDCENRLLASSYPSVRPPARMEHLCFHQTDFCEICNSIIFFEKSVEEIQL